MGENTIQISVNLVYVFSLGILCIISLLLAVFYDQRRLLKQKIQASTSSQAPKPKFIATKSGRVMVTREKIPVIYNDDDKIWQREQSEKATRRRDDGSE